MDLRPRMQWQTAAGNPVTVGDVTVIPQSRALTIRLPGGGFVWNQPIAVLVKRNGRVERIPIRDLTRSLQFGLLGLGLLVAIIGSIGLARGKE